MFYPATFYGSVCISQVRWSCINAKGIDCVPIYAISIEFWSCSDGLVYFVFFILLMRDRYPFQLWDGLELWRSTNKCYVCNKIRLIPIIQWLIDCLICVYILTLSIMQQLPLDKVISNRIIWIQIPVLTTRRSLKIKIKIKISNVLRTTLTETTIHTYNNGDISLHFTHYSAVIVLTP